MAQRRRNRFSRLEQQFRESGGQAAPGSKLAGYIDFKKGINKVEVRDARKLTSAQRTRYGYAVLPFGLSVIGTITDADRYAAAVTQYSLSFRTEIGLSLGELGLEEIVAATQQADEFYPALVKPFINFGTEITPVSGITKKEYSRKDGRSITLPFGRTATSVTDAKTGTTDSSIDDVDYNDMRSSLLVKLKNKSVTSGKITSVSFEPEVWKSGRATLASPPTT